jgi:serine/threonine-protein kinase HipA
LQFLKASDHPEDDQRLFIKAQVVFWLLGATDGHAKNFSVFLYPGGGFRLTPLYDVMSTQPALDSKQIQRKQMRLAMSVGDTRHYILDTILPRHFIQSAAQAGMSASVIHRVMSELMEQTPQAIATALEKLPDDFPEAISESIVGGVQRRLRLIEESLKPPG